MKILFNWKEGPQTLASLAIVAIFEAIGAYYGCLFALKTFFGRW